MVATATQGMSDDARIRELAELIRKKCSQQQAQVPGGQLPGSTAVAQVRRILTLLNFWLSLVCQVCPNLKNVLILLSPESFRLLCA